jgi:molybdate transport system substrate-binding protein
MTMFRGVIIKASCSVCLAVVFCLANSVYADTLKVAVASNALKAVEDIARRFEQSTGHKILISAGSTSKLYTQILNGAPFDVFLAANEREPEALQKQNLIIPGSRFTYAVGRLVLFSKDTQRIGQDGASFLHSGKFQRLAIANPETAPYGKAAQQVLQALDLWQSISTKLVRGENIGQAFQYTATGNVDAGFVALADVKQLAADAGGSYWLVPQTLYAPLRQQAVILKRSGYPETAQTFLNYLQSEATKKILQQDYGYGVEE